MEGQGLDGGDKVAIGDPSNRETLPREPVVSRLQLLQAFGIVFRCAMSLIQFSGFAV